MNFNNTHNAAPEKYSLLNIFSILLIIVILFQPIYSIIIETLDNPQDITLNDKELSDSEEDDNQEDEREEKFVEGYFLETSNISVASLSSFRPLCDLEYWKDYIVGITTPPPEFSK
ncbi:MAG: hypothetical protein KC454_11515 [Flavobacteriales bacterium]|nr:hypothetical protein [Flavobacteriales bacterium]